MATEREDEAAGRRVSATFTLGMRRSSSDPAIKALSRAEAEARLDLAKRNHNGTREEQP